VKFGVVFNAIIKRTGWFHPKDSLLKVSWSPMNFVPSTNTDVWVLQRPVKCEQIWYMMYLGGSGRQRECAIVLVHFVYFMPFNKIIM
jgi:hypothetical protein